MVKKTPDICPYCGHVILDDDQEYCDYCGMDIEKEEVPDKKASRTCLGIIGTAFFFLFCWLSTSLRGNNSICRIPLLLQRKLAQGSISG